MKVIAADWYTPPLVGILADLAIISMGMSISIGIVAIETNQGKNWKAYIGYGTSGNQSQDEKSVALNGAKLGKDMACATFPKLDPKKFVY